MTQRDELGGDANDCRVGVISEAELEGAAFMAYLGRSANEFVCVVAAAHSHARRVCIPLDHHVFDNDLEG